jgi:hypothetical protein
MSTDEKIIKNKVGLLKLSEMLDSVSEACKDMGYSRDSFYRQCCTRRAASWRCMRSADANPVPRTASKNTWRRALNDRLRAQYLLGRQASSSRQLFRL